MVAVFLSVTTKSATGCGAQCGQCVRERVTTSSTSPNLNQLESSSVNLFHLLVKHYRSRKKKAAPKSGPIAKTHYYCSDFGYFTRSTMALNASGLFIARSARALRLSSTPFFAKLPMKTE